MGCGSCERGYCSEMSVGCRNGMRRRVFRAGTLEKSRRMAMAAVAEAVLAPNTSRELSLTRIIDAPREKVYRAWTIPELLKQWFAPQPWPTPHAELDVRPGGANLVVMRGPQGQEF